MNKSKSGFVIAIIAIIVILIAVFFIKGGDSKPEPTASPSSQSESSSSEVSPQSTETQSETDSSVISNTASVDNVDESSISDNQTPPPENLEEVPVKELTEKETMAPSEGSSAELYTVVDGNKLDAHSYEGFKLYRNWCARCHGTYGQGMVGPNLVESLNRISKQEFVDVVTNGKLGQIGSMPAWESNPSVMNGMDNLYAYLKARADGALGETKPARQ